jgi:hypothetical protein
VSGKLDIGDAEGLRDLSDRCARAARTARSTAAEDDEAAAMLMEVAERAEYLAGSATALAEWVEQNRNGHDR